MSKQLTQVHLEDMLGVNFCPEDGQIYTIGTTDF